MLYIYVCTDDVGCPLFLSNLCRAACERLKLLGAFLERFFCITCFDKGSCAGQCKQLVRSAQQNNVDYFGGVCYSAF